MEGIDTRRGQLPHVRRIHAAAGHDLDAARSPHDERAEVADAFGRRIAAAGSQDAGASGADDLLQRIGKVARHVERPVEGGLHRPGFGHEGRRTRRIDPSVGRQQAEDHAVGAAFAGEAHLFEHLPEFGVVIEEISAAGTDHHTELQAFDAAHHTDGRGRRGRAALVGRGAEFDARDTRTAGGLARFNGIGTKFGRHTAKIKKRRRKCKSRSTAEQLQKNGTGPFIRYGKKTSPQPESRRFGRTPQSRTHAVKPDAHRKAGHPLQSRTPTAKPDADGKTKAERPYGRSAYLQAAQAPI